MPNVLSPRDLVFSPDVGQKLYHHHIGSLFLFISKVSSRIGVSLMDGQGIRLSLLPSSFLPLLSLFIPSPFSIPFSSYFLIPPFPLSHPNCLLFFSSPSPLSLLQVLIPSHFLFTSSILRLPLPPYFSFSQSFSPYTLPAPISLVLTLFSPFTDTISLLFSPYSLLPHFFSPLTNPISLLIKASNSSQNLQ